MRESELHQVIFINANIYIILCKYQTYISVMNLSTSKIRKTTCCTQKGLLDLNLTVPGDYG